jgi:hypothetical protein
MSRLNSNRLAWSVAAAALALWATSAPSTWGEVASWAARLFDQVDASTSTSSESTTVISVADDGTPIEPCLPIPPAVVESMPATSPETTPPAANEARYRLCGADQDIARAIEQLIAGRGFSTSLMSRGDGCAELIVRITSAGTSGSASSSLNVSIGSGRSLSLKIVSAQGATHVTLSES